MAWSYSWRELVDTRLILDREGGKTCALDRYGPGTGIGAGRNSSVTSPVGAPLAEWTSALALALSALALALSALALAPSALALVLLCRVSTLALAMRRG